VHSIQHHLSEDHKDVSLVDYQARFPGSPIMSEIMRSKLEERARAKAAGVGIPLEGAVASVDVAAPWGAVKKPLHEVFGLGPVPAAMSAKGAPIMITVFNPDNMDEFDRALIPKVDPNYVFNLDVLRTLIVGIEKRIPTYLWGHAGTGKTTMWEQIMARLNRPMIRTQHTANMEESHVTGQYLLRDGATRFEEGPLMMAMRRGWVYLGDEYDFGRPEVLSVYQPVLEGKALVVKEAELAKRVTQPHPCFFFCGTGNTNGTGDETGLYQGTNQQNAANYERFGITEKMPYMEAELEARVVSAQGAIPVADAKKLVDFANRIREQFDGGKMSNPISPRTLIFAAQVGKARASYKVGLEKAFINRLSSVDRETASQLAQRVLA
jgi:cobaltochelatase CobS